MHHVGNRDAAVALNGLACGGLENHSAEPACELKSADLAPGPEGLGLESLNPKLVLPSGLIHGSSFHRPDSLIRGLAWSLHHGQQTPQIKLLILSFNTH